jgi:flagellar biosynthesis protein FliR
MTGKNWLKGMIAGFIATLVLSALMLMKQQMGVMPQLNPVEMLTKMAGGSTPAVGWTIHFLIGTVLWGTTFS